MEIICQIMEKCLSLSARIKDSPDLKDKHDIIKKLYPGALLGMCSICDLYASPKEKEYLAANNLDTKINGYILSVLHLHSNEDCSRVPAPREPCTIPQTTPSLPYRAITSIALPIISSACTLVACYSTTTSAIRFVSELAAYDENNRLSRFRLLFQALKLINEVNLL